VLGAITEDPGTVIQVETVLLSPVGNEDVQVIIVKYHCYPVPCTESLVSYQDKGISGKRIFHIAVAIGKKASELIAPE